MLSVLIEFPTEKIHGGMSVIAQLGHSRYDEASNVLVVMKQPVADKNEAASWVLQLRGSTANPTGFTSAKRPSLSKLIG